MKYFLSTCMLLVFAFSAMPTTSANAQIFGPGSLIKGSMSSLYYYGEDGKRYVFPNEKTYFTWYTDFKNVVQIPDSALGTIPIGGNVTYRPGKKMIKITTDPKVYAVDRGGVLRHVSSEQLAQTFYNINWNQQIDDVPDPFFINYRIGDPVQTTTEYDPSDVMTQTTTISQNKGFTSSMAAVSIGSTQAGFVPSSMTIKKGATVTWTNQDSLSHSIVGTGYESSALSYRGTYEHKFDQVGSFEYHCGIYPSMKATINVIP